MTGDPPKSSPSRRLIASAAWRSAAAPRRSTATAPGPSRAQGILHRLEFKQQHGYNDYNGSQAHIEGGYGLLQYSGYNLAAMKVLKYCC